MVGRVPITREINRETLDAESVEIPQEDRNDVISTADAKRSTGEEIVLDVRNEQRIVNGQRLHSGMRFHQPGWSYLVSRDSEECSMLDSQCSIEHSTLNIEHYGCSHYTNDDQVMSLSLLRQETNVRQHVLHFSVGELPPPGMHRAEDDPVLDRSQ